MESESIAEIEKLRIELGTEEIEVEDPKADKPLKNITEENAGEQEVTEGLETINLKGETAGSAETIKKFNKKAKVLILIEDHLTIINAIEYEQGIAAPSDVTAKWKIDEHIQACAAAKEVLTYFESEIGGPGQIERVAWKDRIKNVLITYLAEKKEEKLNKRCMNKM